MIRARFTGPESRSFRRPPGALGLRNATRVSIYHHGVGQPDAGDDGAPEDRALITHEVAPEPGSQAGSLGSLLPDDLSDAAGESDLLDPVLAAVAAAPSAPRRERELQPGDRIGESFRIERRLGSGGMGVVYLARDESLDRPVAVKLHRAGAGVDRLQREAMAMARLAHPHVITVHEVGRLDDRVFVAMEFVPGGTLRAWLKARPRPWRDALALCLAAGEGLAAAHDAGLVHRDFKPENVLVGDDGRPRVGDFGLARAIGESATDLVTSDLRSSGLRTPVPAP
ncbi:MAG: serine/threonine protein kinase, partial [Deltaproteobacteria bacterium]|nr:serine/threonine protein kinase [Kofleriaceae bacterium]